MAPPISMMTITPAPRARRLHAKSFESSVRLGLTFVRHVHFRGSTSARSNECLDRAPTENVVFLERSAMAALDLSVSMCLLVISAQPQSARALTRSEKTYAA